MGLYYEEWEIGKEYRSPSVTVTETHFVIWCSLTQINHPLHTDEEYCKNTRYGCRIAQGSLIVSLASGLIGRLGLKEGTMVKSLGIDRIQFLKPVFIGDTITCIDKVINREDDEDPRHGVVKFMSTVLNQKGEEVMRQEAASVFLRSPR